MNNKAVVTKLIFSIPRILFLVVILFGTVLVIKSLVVTTVDIRETEATVLAKRLLLAREGIMFTDDQTNRIYPGTIDRQHFIDLQKIDLASSLINYPKPNRYSAAKIVLRQPDLVELETYYNKQQYLDWIDRSRLPTVKDGAGVITRHTFVHPVLIRHEKTMAHGQIEITVLI